VHISVISVDKEWKLGITQVNKAKATNENRLNTATSQKKQEKNSKSKLMLAKKQLEKVPFF